MPIIANHFFCPSISYIVLDVGKYPSSTVINCRTESGSGNFGW